jgi:dTDP-4-amino-4,6-dideoxygalactose transaminase
MLLVKLPHLERWIARRRAIAGYYIDELAGGELRLPVEAPETRHVFHLFAVRHAERDRWRSDLAARGIGTLVHYPRAVHQHPAYAEFAHPDLKCAEEAAAEVVSLPLFPELRDSEVERVIDEIRDRRPAT